MTNRAKKRLTLLLVVFAALGLLVAGGAVIRAVQQQRITERALERGLAALESGDDRGVVRHLGVYLNRAENAGEEVDPELWINWTDARWAVKDDEGQHIAQAIVGARRARDLLPSDPRPYEQLIEIYSRIGQYTELADAADRLLEIDPDNFRARAAKIASARATGDLDAAIEEARLLVDAHPDSVEAHQLLLFLLDEAGRPPEELVGIMEAAAEAHPDNPDFELLRARTHVLLDDRDAARRSAERALAMIEEAPDADIGVLLRVLDYLGMDEEARRLLETRVELAEPGDPIFVVAAERAWKAGETDEARAILDAGAPTLDDAPSAMLGWIALLNAGADGDAERFEAARARLDEVATAESADWLALVDAREALEDARPSDAREIVGERAPAGGPETRPLMQYALARAAKTLGERRRAIELLEPLAAREPRWVILAVDLAELLLGEDRLTQAFGYAIRAYRAAPRPGVVIPTLAEVAARLLESGRATPAQRDLAIEVLTEAAEKLSDSGEALALAARGLAATGRYNEARALTQRIAEQRRQITADSYARLAELSRRRQWGLESALTEAVRAASPEDPATLYALAIEAANAGRPEDGERLLDDALGRAGESASLELAIRRALYLDAIGDPEARETLLQLATQNERSVPAQLAVLEASSTWVDEPGIAAAIERLRALTGDEGVAWKLHEARRLLTFEPSEENAARVELLLAEIINNDRRSAEARRIAAAARLELGDVETATRYLREAVAARPGDARLQLELVNLLREAGDTEAVIRQLREFAAIGDLSRDLRQVRGRLLMDYGLWDPALEDLSAVAEDGDWRASLDLARLHARRGETARARAIYNSLLTEPDPDPAALEAAANFFGGLGEVDRGQAILMRLPEEGDPPRVRRIASYLARYGLSSEAERLFRRHAEEDGTPEAWNALARFLVRQGAIEDARSALEQGLALAPEDHDLIATENVIRLRMGLPVDPDALADAMAVGGVDPDDPAAIALRKAIASLSEAPDDRSAYIEALREVTETYPSFYPAWDLLVKALRSVAKLDEAISVAQRAAAALPTDPRPARLHAEALIASGDAQRAIVAARSWRDRSRDNPLEADVAIASLELSLNEPEQALEQLQPHRERIVSQGDAHPDRLALLATALARAGQAERAHELLWPRAQQDPRWAERYFNVALSQRDTPSTFVRWLSRIEPAIVSTPMGRLRIGQAWYEFGLIHESAEAHRRAMDILEPSLDDEQMAPVAAKLIAGSAEQIGEHVVAERHYRLAIQLDPDDPAVMNNLAYLILRTNGSGEEALSLAERAVEAAPDVPVFVDTRASALLALGRLEEAREEFRRGLELDPGDVDLLLGLAETELRLGAVEAATVALERAAARGPRNAAQREELADLGSRLEKARARSDE